MKYLFKVILFFNLLLLSITPLFAQRSFGQNPASWSYQISEQSANTYKLTLRAEIEPGWHMYDMKDYGEYVISTSFDFESSDSYELVGELKALTPSIVKRDETIAQDVGYYVDSAVFEQVFKVNSDDVWLRGNVRWMLCNDTSCTPPSDYEFEVQVISEGGAGSMTKGLWTLIIEAILWGFAALLTPCVFPMVPMTMSYFLKQNASLSHGRVKAIMYGVFIIGLYTLPIAAIILITRMLGGDAVTADIFNWLSTHWLPNLLFFFVFMAFAASFFGAFEITLPSKLVNSSDAKASKKGLSGVFFMALTLVIVSFSCTGPIVGSVLIKSTSGEFWEPIITMLAFSSAFALPFIVFALSPSLLRNLPKSGGWLGSVKIVLGFVELALGLKFLSVADQTYGWGILDREIYLALWIVIFSLLGLYLLGKLRFASQAEFKGLTITRLFLSIATFTFVVYMIPGLFGAPLSALSGYLPPMHTHDFVMTKSTYAQVNKAQDTDRKYNDMFYLKEGLTGFFTLEEGKAYAQAQDKPMLIYFTGHACVNCRVMSERVWSDSRVHEILSNDFVIVSLYLDSKYELPASEWVTSESGRVLKTIGRINSYYASSLYKVSSQPTYIIADDKGQELMEPRGYNLDVDKYITFLEKGLKAYKNENK